MLSDGDQIQLLDSVEGQLDFWQEHLPHTRAEINDYQYHLILWAIAGK
jgi:hypothetical protein